MREVQLFNRLGDEMEEGNRKLVLIRVRINRELEGDREIFGKLLESCRRGRIPVIILFNYFLLEDSLFQEDFHAINVIFILSSGKW